MTAIRKTQQQAPQQAKKTGNKTMSIGVVIQRLREEFPDVTVSKIRFLESEGLISPERTESGYRRFTEADIDRLRYILVTQRDNYLPLKVIREQLEAMDSGDVVVVSEQVISSESIGAAKATRLTDKDVAVQAQCEQPFVTKCINAGLIVPDSSGLFSADDVRIVSTAASLAEFGLDGRHLKALRNAAGRQADMVAKVVDPVAKSGKASAKQEADELGQQVASLVVSLNSALVKNELRRGLGA
ncbi:MerR family transcriptional regulator [Corynebacterium sp. CCUG 65737]|uniref:transcriptional regulator FtsR n=1 Tax=Corynebacterium sp. CCUG 65737 TaxID=2823889 RepID=UPI00210ACCB9|nr:MerR family transcriptional regulator [Corynebacterium sp. CCUG 65737]